MSGSSLLSQKWDEIPDAGTIMEMAPALNGVSSRKSNVRRLSMMSQTEELIRSTSSLNIANSPLSRKEQIKEDFLMVLKKNRTSLVGLTVPIFENNALSGSSSERRVGSFHQQNSLGAQPSQTGPPQSEVTVLLERIRTRTNSSSDTLGRDSEVSSSSIATLPFVHEEIQKKLGRFEKLLQLLRRQHR